ncbi:tail fiber domain-containing protein [Spirosoma validum]|uniref:Tail fiber domain-containing protein n=1 Tax=Spirosoma validum TaxID=2771355 RepID=A0A927GGS3_9BACT|nr:tail fiber domain-containing protein [Spirosoma validum]MBD2757181.1 tail fiber domain-containing protein [Spirosoma validum]
MKIMIVYGQKFTVSTCFIVAALNVHAQMTIGPSASPTNGSASLEIKAGPYSSGSSYRGLLPPTVTTTQRGQIQNPATGLLVFNTSTQQIEVNTGTPTGPVWTPGGVASTSGNGAWSITGNAGTGNTSFLGTTDNVPLRFRVNNQNAGRIDATLYNLGLGYLAFNPTATGQANTAIGTYSLYYLTSGNYNTASGFQALHNTTTGAGNTASGAAALVSNSTGSGNSAVGNVALQSNTSGNNNAALGINAMQKNSTGNYNTAVGASALQNNTTADANTAIGHNALAVNTTGYVNVAVGEDALSSNIDGHDNVSVGNTSLADNTQGLGNVAAGNVALRSNTTGQYNSALGTQALYYNTTGNFNTALGCNAGPLQANSNLTNSTAIGANARVNANNQIVLGDNNITSLRCNVQTISSLSDKRIKEDIKANVPGLRFITKLTPVTYYINKTKEAKLVGYALESIHEDKTLHSGFLAQDVEAAAQAVGYNFEGVRQEEGGKYYTLGYTLFVMPLVQAVKELNAEVNQLKVELAAAKQIEKATQARLDKIEALLQNPAPHAAMSFSTK